MNSLFLVLTAIFSGITLVFSLISILMWIGIPAAIIIAVGNLAGLFSVSWIWFFISLIPIVAFVLAKIFVIFTVIFGGIAGITK